MHCSVHCEAKAICWITEEAETCPMFMVKTKYRRYLSVRSKSKEAKMARANMMAENPDHPKHATLTGYHYYCCRCPRCRGAQKQYRDDKLAEGVRRKNGQD